MTGHTVSAAASAPAPAPAAALYLFSAVVLLHRAPADAAAALLPRLSLPPLPEPLVRAAVGALSGSCGAVAAYPFDCVKARLQVQEATPPPHGDGDGDGYGSGSSLYANGWDAAATIAREEGALALYRGVEVSALGYAPESATAFAVNEAARGAFRDALLLNPGGAVATGGLPLPLPLPWWAELASGASAGLAQVVVTNPIEAVKVRRQTSDRTLAEVLEVIGRRPSDLYRGAGVCALRDSVFNSVLFFTYARAKDAAATMDFLGGDGTLMVRVLSACLAAAPAAYISTPADVVKTRMQRRAGVSGAEGSGEDDDDGDGDGTVSPLEVARRIWREGGDGRPSGSALFRGGLERVLRFVPTYGVTLSMYDALTEWAVGHGLLVEAVATATAQ